MKMNSILNTNSIIRGVKNQKQMPQYGNDPKLGFDKKKPIHAHNFPLTKFTDWKIYGYKKDPSTGMKRPCWINKRLPTGKSINPRDVGLDGFFDVKTTQVI